MANILKNNGLYKTFPNNELDILLAVNRKTGEEVRYSELDAYKIKDENDFQLGLVLLRNRGFEILDDAASDIPEIITFLHSFEHEIKERFLNWGDAQISTFTSAFSSIGTIMQRLFDLMESFIEDQDERDAERRQLVDSMDFAANSFDNAIISAFSSAIEQNIIPASISGVAEKFQDRLLEEFIEFPMSLDFIVNGLLDDLEHAHNMRQVYDALDPTLWQSNSEFQLLLDRIKAFEQYLADSDNLNEYLTFNELRDARRRRL